MRRVAMGMLLGLGAAVGLLVAACAPAATTPDTAPTVAPGVTRTSTPVTGAMATPGAASGTPRAATPTSQVMGVQATPGPTETAVAAEAMGQSLLRDMDRFRDQLRGLSTGRPTPMDLMAMVQQGSVLMDELDRGITNMSRQHRGQALSQMSAIMGLMADVMETHARQAGEPLTLMATPGPMTGTPGPMMGTPGTPMPGGMMQATPTAGAMTTEQRMMAMDQMRDQMMRQANGQPTAADIIAMMRQMQQMLATMSQEADQMSEEEIQALTDNMAQVMEDLVLVMDAHLQQEPNTGPAWATPDATTNP